MTAKSPPKNSLRFRQIMGSGTIMYSETSERDCASFENEYTGANSSKERFLPPTELEHDASLAFLLSLS